MIQLSRADQHGRPPTASKAGASRVGRWAAARVLPGLFGFTLVALILAGGGLLGSGDAPISQASSTLAGVSTVRATRQPAYEIVREFVGRVEARRQSKLSLELGGLVREVLVDEREMVERGEIIALLDTKLLHSQRESIAAQLAASQSRLQEMVAGPRHEVIQAARAEVDRWQAQVSLAEITRRRNAKLVAQNAASRQDLDDAALAKQTYTAQVRAAKARLLELENGTRHEQIVTQTSIVDQLRAELETVDISIEKSKLLAPFRGVISNRFVDEGVVIDASTPLVQLLETDRLDVRVGVSDESLSGLTVGSKQTVVIGNSEYHAEVRAVRPDRNQQTRTISVLLTLEANGQQVHIGDLATIRLSGQIQEPGFWLPLSTLTESYRGLWGCYTVTGAGDSSGAMRLQLRELEVIHQTSSKAFVRGTLRHGEDVVSNGVHRLVPNQIVRVIASVDSVAVSHRQAITQREEGR